MSWYAGMYTFLFVPMKTSVARYEGFMFGSERRPPKAQREDLLDVALVRKVARCLPEDKVVQRELLALGPHEGELIDHASLLVLETVDRVGGDGLPSLHLNCHLIILDGR